MPINLETPLPLLKDRLAPFSGAERRENIDNDRRGQRLDIDNSILATLITLSQSMGQIQGEIAILKVAGLDLKPIQAQLESLNKIVITGDLNADSLISQIRNLKDKVSNLQNTLDNLQSTKMSKDHEIALEETKALLDRKKINQENVWKILIAIGTVLATGIGAWFNLK